MTTTSALTLRSSRRGFGKLLFIAAAFASVGTTTVLESACTFGSVFTAILKYVAVGLQAFQSVVDLLAGAGVLPLGSGAGADAIIALVKAAFADLQVAVTNYNNAPSAQKSTLLGKVSTALSSVEAYIQQFWNDLKVPDPKLASLVQGLLGIIVATIGGFATQLPAPAPTPVTSRAAQLPNRIQATPQKVSPGEFKKRFNAKLAEGGYSQYAIK